MILSLAHHSQISFKSRLSSVGLDKAFGIAEASVSISTIIPLTIPMFIVVLAALQHNQNLSLLKQNGIAAAFVGVAFVVTGQENTLNQVSKKMPLGISLVLLSSMAIALYHVLSIELSSQYCQ